MKIISHEESRSVSCDTCHAQIGEHCKSSSGTLVNFSHSNRWAKVRDAREEQARMEKYLAPHVHIIKRPTATKRRAPMAIFGMLKVHVRTKQGLIALQQYLTGLPTIAGYEFINQSSELDEISKVHGDAPRRRDRDRKPINEHKVSMKAKVLALLPDNDQTFSHWDVGTMLVEKLGGKWTSAGSIIHNLIISGHIERVAKSTYKRIQS